MIVNICGNRFTNLYKQWARAYHYLIKTFLELGYDVHRSQHMDWDSSFEIYNLPIIEEDSEDYIYVHNHTWRRELDKQGFYTGIKLFIVKPTGPTTDHFTLDSEGYACSSSITYEKPDFENISSSLFKFFSENIASTFCCHISKYLALLVVCIPIIKSVLILPTNQFSPGVA